MTIKTGKLTYKVTEIQGRNRLAMGSDGEAYVSHKATSGRWSRWTKARLTVR